MTKTQVGQLELIKELKKLNATRITVAKDGTVSVDFNVTLPHIEDATEQELATTRELTDEELLLYSA